MAHKVLLLARELGLGGTERQLAETALALDRSKFEPHVGCFNDGGFRARDLREAGVPIVELGVRSLISGSAVAGARRLGGYIGRHGIELVHAFDVPADLFATPVARLYRAGVVLSSQRAHRGLIGRGQRQLLRLTDRIVDGIVVNSRSVARELAAEDGVPESMIRLAYNGLDTAVFRSQGPRAPLPWDGPGPVIGTVCALRPEKGLLVLVEAFARVQTAHPEARLVIVGSGPMLGELRARAGTNTHFEPAVAQVAPWLRSMDVFVLPSLTEALSNSLMEAMGCGCCPVASDVGGNPELVEHGKTGLLFPSGDAEALAARLGEVVRDPALRQGLAGNAERLMREKFTREIAARRMGEIYLEYLEGR